MSKARFWRYQSTRRGKIGGVTPKGLQTASQNAARVVELDALRGLAALAVVAFHYTTLYGELYGHSGPPPLSFGFGNYGVHLFFLISGFVIFMTLERTRSAMDFVV